MTSSAIEVVLAHDELAELDPARRRLALRRIAAEFPDAGVAPSVAELADHIDGFGPLSGLMKDPEITDVLVNGHDEIWIERAGRLRRTSVTFESEASLRMFVDRFLGVAGRRVDASEPIADAALPDGSRLHVILPPVSRGGTILSIRRFPDRRYSLSELTERGMLTQREADILAAAVSERATIAVTGGTGTGKTTMVNALLSLVGPSERVVVIEETPELFPGCPHAVRLTTRGANVSGYGSVAAVDLVRAALRMRPDRIVVGEVRGPEALAALAAMSTGHQGSMVTLHARSPSDAVKRMVSLAMQAGTGISEASLVTQFDEAFDVLLHLERYQGSRRVASLKRRVSRRNES